jgi:Cu/Ag efflux protein CusF
MEEHYMKQGSINGVDRRLATLILLVNLLLASVAAMAHGDLIHVVGTVAKVSDTTVSVKTSDGKIVEVQFGEKTTYLRLKRAIAKGAIKAGDRIVIHAAKVNEKLVARKVEIGIVPPAQKGAK